MTHMANRSTHVLPACMKTSLDMLAVGNGSHGPGYISGTCVCVCAGRVTLSHHDEL